MGIYVGNTGGSGQGVLPEIKLTTLSGTLLILDPSGYLQAVNNWNFRSIRVNPDEAGCKDQRSILMRVSILWMQPRYARGGILRMSPKWAN
eukprot:9202540-Ditylum_brightwellii.AAC.1